MQSQTFAAESLRVRVHSLLQGAVGDVSKWDISKVSNPPERALVIAPDPHLGNPTLSIHELPGGDYAELSFKCDGAIGWFAYLPDDVRLTDMLRGFYERNSEFGERPNEIWFRRPVGEDTTPDEIQTWKTDLAQALAEVVGRMSVQLDQYNADCEIELPKAIEARRKKLARLESLKNIN